MSVSDRLRDARLKAGYKSAADAARRLNTPYGTYSGHENGLRGAGPHDLKKYAKLYGVSASWLMYGESEAGQTGMPFEIQICDEIGSVGSTQEGRILFYREPDVVLLPQIFPGEIVCFEVDGSWIIDFAPPDSLIICDAEVKAFEDDQRTNPLIVYVNKNTAHIGTMNFDEGSETYSIDVWTDQPIIVKKILGVSQIRAVLYPESNLYLRAQLEKFKGHIVKTKA